VLLALVLVLALLVLAVPLLAVPVLAVPADWEVAPAEQPASTRTDVRSAEGRMRPGRGDFALGVALFRWVGNAVPRVG
jgi:hypothetical protein